MFKIIFASRCHDFHMSLSMFKGPPSRKQFFPCHAHRTFLYIFTSMYIVIRWNKLRSHIRGYLNDYSLPSWLEPSLSHSATTYIYTSSGLVTRAVDIGLFLLGHTYPPVSQAPVMEASQGQRPRASMRRYGEASAFPHLPVRNPTAIDIFGVPMVLILL